MNARDEPFVLLDLQVGEDATAVRHVVGRAAHGLGLGDHNATRLGTAVSEIGRVAARLGSARVVLEAAPDPAAEGSSLRVRFTFDDDADGAWRRTLEQDGGLARALGRLVDEFVVTPDGVTVTKDGGAALSVLELTELRHRLLADRPGDLRTVLESQNAELLGALGTLIERESELVRLNDELEQTNRGVVALYAELEHRAAQVRTAQRGVFVELERALRPTPLLVPGLELDVRYLPAQVNSPTGGDLYDWVVLPDGALHVAVVDVLGHGVTSTRDALRVTHTLRTLVQEGYALADVLARADALLQLPARPLYATALVVRLDTAAGRLEIAGAGHPPALLTAADGSVRYLEAPGRPLGYPGAGSTGSIALDLEPGDCLLLYTDGLVEVRHDIVEGLATLETAAVKASSMALPQLLDTVLGACLQGDTLRDDTLLLGLRRYGADESSPREALGVTLPPTVEASGLARQYLLENAADLASGVVDDALVMMSELVGNAVRHGGAPVRLTLTHVDSGIRVEVYDGGPVFEHDATALPSLTPSSGRGLFLVQALSRSWGVVPGDEDTGGKTVWFEI